MYQIVHKKVLNPTVTQMEIHAPLVAKKAKPGQFIILRVNEEGERIPLTVAGCNVEEGTVKIIFQIVGATTALLNHKQEGEFIQDFVGPLIMMKFVVATAKPFGVPVTVSMNPIMIDGTGMCGGCRLTLNQDGKRVTKFACVDGPDFDGYEVDFDEAMSRGRMYNAFERKAYEETCNLLKQG